MKGMFMTILSVVTAACVATAPVSVGYSMETAADSFAPVSVSSGASEENSSPQNTADRENSSVTEDATKNSYSTGSENNGSVEIDSIPNSSSESATGTESVVTSATEKPEDEGTRASVQSAEEQSSPALMPLTTPPEITPELAALLATNQADSMMGNYGITRSAVCKTEVARLTVAEFNTTDNLDYNYAMLWQALEQAFASINKNGGMAANCTFENGFITVLA